MNLFLTLIISLASATVIAFCMDMIAQIMAYRTIKTQKMQLLFA